MRTQVFERWVIRPVPAATLAGLADALAAFPPGFMVGGRDLHEQADRSWGALPSGPSPPDPQAE